jgi:hypothetical protein
LDVIGYVHFSNIPVRLINLGDISLVASYVAHSRRERPKTGIEFAPAKLEALSKIN